MGLRLPQKLSQRVAQVRVAPKSHPPLCRSVGAWLDLGSSIERRPTGSKCRPAFAAAKRAHRGSRCCGCIHRLRVRRTAHARRSAYAEPHSCLPPPCPWAEVPFPQSFRLSQTRIWSQGFKAGPGPLQQRAPTLCGVADGAVHCTRSGRAGRHGEPQRQGPRNAVTAARGLTSAVTARAVLQDRGKMDAAQRAGRPALSPLPARHAPNAQQKKASRFFGALGRLRVAPRPGPALTMHSSALACAGTALCMRCSTHCHLFAATCPCPFRCGAAQRARPVGRPLAARRTYRSCTNTSLALHNL